MSFVQFHISSEHGLASFSGLIHPTALRLADSALPEAGLQSGAHVLDFKHRSYVQVAGVPPFFGHFAALYFLLALIRVSMILYFDSEVYIVNYSFI